MRIRLIALYILIVLLVLTGCVKKEPINTEKVETSPTPAIIATNAGIKINGEVISAAKDAPKEKVAKVLAGDGGKYLNAIDPLVIPSLLNATNEKYVYVGEAKEGLALIETTKVKLDTMYKTLANDHIKEQGNSYSVESIDQMEKDAVAVLKEISSNDKAASNIYITYEGNDDFKSTAFNSHIGKSSKVKNGKNSGEYDTKGHFKEEGLLLEMENIKVDTVIGGEIAAKFGSITIIVSADTKCVQNDGAYKDLEWIPKVGETKNIKYVVSFWSDFALGQTHEVILQNISVVK